MIKQYIFSKIKYNNFYEITFIKRLKLPFYELVTNKSTTKNIKCTPSHILDATYNSQVHFSTYIPPFIVPVIHKDFKKIEFERFTGFAINLETYGSVETYMTDQFGSKSRRRIRSYLKRLETCFNITYVTYYGHIDIQTYNVLISCLELMIIRRFDQRNDEHQALKTWDFYKNNMFDLINAKKASLFVIYDNDKPIDICLNTHHEYIYVNDIRAFDTDYSKFKLGYIDILKQLEWCLENDHKIFDLGPGLFSYKIQWCNMHYKFKNQIIFYKKSLLLNIFGSALGLFYKLKLFLDRHNIKTDNADKNQDNRNGNHLTESAQEFDIQSITNINPNYDLININIEDRAYTFLRKCVYDLLYLNFENKNNMSLYKLNEKNNSFILKGKNLFLLTPKNN